MVSDAHLVVECPDCRKQYAVRPDDKKFNCTHCGKTFPFAVSSDHHTVVDLQERLDKVTTKLDELTKSKKPLADEEATSLKEEIERIKELFMNNRRVVPEPIISVMQSRILYVDRNLVDSVVETTHEFGISLSMFSLFFGLTLQEAFSRRPIGFLTLTTLMFFFVTCYLFYKGQKRTQAMKDSATTGPLKMQPPTR